MAKDKPNRLSKIAKEFNLGISTIVEFLAGKNIEVELNPNAKIEPEVYDLLVGAFQSDKAAKEKSQSLNHDKIERETVSLEDKVKIEPIREEIHKDIFIKNLENTVDKGPEKKTYEEGEPRVIGKIDLSAMNLKTRPTKKEFVKEKPVAKIEPKVEPKVEVKPEVKETKKEEPVSKVPEHIETVYEKREGPTVLGKIELPVEKSRKDKEKDKKKPVASSVNDTSDANKRKRKRIATGAVEKKDFSKTSKPAERKPYAAANKPGFKGKKEPKPELTEIQIQQQVKDTLARLSGGGKNKSAKLRRAKRDDHRSQREEEVLEQEKREKIVKVTEFVTANELATMMKVSVNEIISACMSLGLFVSINQRLDAETISIVAEEFGYSVEFISAGVQEAIEIEIDNEEDLIDRPPIVTVMGHVDHGKTSLLDHIRSANVIAGEAGGITQHIGAYSVMLEDSGKRITFLDTPGHEAFTAMRARGAQVTDIAIIIIAADDDVMPQTKEAINHAQAAGVPMIFAINKIDREGANPDKIREQLSAMNILVEEWGGKYQCQEISAKKGTNVFELLEKVLLEAEMLELKANPNKNAVGTVIESELDKGRGYVSTLLIESGTMRVGDVILAGSFAGKVKAMHDERGNVIKEAGPSTPVSILGIPGAPSAGERFNVMNDEREAKAIAVRRETLQREQGVRTQKHVTLDEIGRRLALGEFKELNLIIKGDVDGSIEALSDSLQKLSTDKVQVNIIHKAVGQISESDVILASASDAIILGFQVRPSVAARKAAEKEQIDIRFYSIIYNAVEEIQSAMEGMLDAKIEEKIVCNVEVRETFNITKVGTIAGCYVLDGKINRNTKIRLIRDGIVIYSGGLGSLKRFKDDVKEVASSYECGLNIDKFNDIKVGDIIEGYEEVEVKQKL